MANTSFSAPLEGDRLEQYLETLAKSGSEHAHQRALFAYFAVIAHQGKEPLARLAFAVPNGGKRDKITAARLKAEGVKSGVPDVIWPVPVGGFASLFLELKVDKNDTSDKQDSWADDLRACGHAVATCWGWRAARQAFIDYSTGQDVQDEYR